MKLILNDNEAIYIQIAKAIEDDILSGEVKEEEQILSTNELSRVYKINPATVLKGINLLVDKCIIYKKRGIGMFVCCGAKEIINKSRKEKFKNIFLKDLFKEATKLGIDRDELIEIIRDYKED